jgi:hypothetical protein
MAPGASRHAGRPDEYILEAHLLGSGRSRLKRPLLLLSAIGVAFVVAALSFWCLVPVFMHFNPDCAVGQTDSQWARNVSLIRVRSGLFVRHLDNCVIRVLPMVSQALDACDSRTSEPAAESNFKSRSLRENSQFIQETVLRSHATVLNIC